ncbi:MAG TPA: PAS domain S-box protein [Planctomycetota bacterium]|jgi:PAS domain S-box-containing protein
MPDSTSSAWARFAGVLHYSYAVAAVAAGLGARLALEAWYGPGLPTYITFYPAVMAVALLAGLGPGLAATALAGLATAYWILPPSGIAVAAPIDRLGLVVFSGMGLFMSVVAALYRRDRAKAAAYDREASLRESREALRQSEERLRVTLASIGDAVLSADTAGRVTYLNPVAVALTGWELAGAMGQPIQSVFKIVNEQTHQPAEDIVARVLREGRAIALANHTALITKDGRTVPIEDSAAPILDAAGKVCGIVLVFHDVTQKRRVQEAQRRATEEWERTFNSVPDLIAILDDQHRVVRANRAMAQRLGVTPEQCVGLRCFEVVHGTDRPPAFCPHAKTLCDCQEHTSEFHEERLGGDFLVTTTPLRDADGRLAGSVHVARDITERKRAEREHEITVELLRVVNESRSLRELVRAAVTFFRQQSGCEAVGVRLRDGDDYPYYETHGFQPDFVLLENHLCARDCAGQICRDNNGYPMIECMCGNIICGRFDAAKPFFTAQGTFWTNCTTELLATSTDADRQTRTRNRCNGEGYESVALIALRVGEERLGLLQLNDKRKGMFSAGAIALWERLAGYLAVALAKLRAEDALRQSEERFRLLVEQNVDGIFLSDPQGHYLDVNSAGCRMLDYSREEILGRTIADIIAAEDVPRIPIEVGRFAGGAVVRSEWRFRRKDGSLFFGEVVGRQLPDGRLLGIVRDITERKQSEEQLRQAKALAEDANRQKDHFLAVLGHELRNPLAPIRNSVSVLKRLGPPDPVLQRARATIDRQVCHMTRLIDDLLDVSRIASGKIQLRKETLDLAAVVQCAVEDHRPLLEEHGLKLSVNMPREKLCVVGDAARITQIVGNLLGNAGKFTDRGGRVDVSVEFDPEQQALIRVSDSGIGLEAETLARLFQPFAQADHSMDRSRGGLGLGLALVKGLAELHGGRVQATSAGLGHGTQFVVMLPSVVKDAASNASLVAVAPRVRPQRILVIEDNYDSAESLQILLELSGNAVAVAHSGPEGLEKAQTHKPEVILCDIGLPGMNGYEVAQAIRKTAELKSVCLIAMTGYGQDEDRVRALEAGFDHHLTKPADPEALERLLAR